MQTSAAAIGASLIPSLAFAEKGRKKSLRFAHITDIHVKPGSVPEAGMAKAFQHVQQLKRKVDFIINSAWVETQISKMSK